MTLIDLYVAEVGKRLPLRGRSDIEAELRSTLEDMLEDRSRKAGRPVDDEMVKDLLKEYGPPDTVAATYHATQYLIGPRLYPFFLMVLKIVLSVLTVVLIVTLGIQLGREPLSEPELVKAIVNGLGGILGAAIGAFGNIALVFAILERVLPASEFRFDEHKKEWDPASLMKEAEKPELRMWEPIAAIVFTAAAMILFNEYPQLIGLSFFRDGQWTSIPALTEAFFRWLPYINVLWALQIALNVVLLRQGRWQPVTRWISIALSAAGIVIGYFLLSGPSVVSLSPAALQSTGLFDAHTAATLSAVAGQGARAIIALIMVLAGVDVVKDVIRLILKRR
jgi:hypothetical protein